MRADREAGGWRAVASSAIEELALDVGGAGVAQPGGPEFRHARPTPRLAGGQLR